MCNVMVSYFKRNQKVQKNERTSRYERSDPSRQDQAYQSMSQAIRVEQIRYGTETGDMWDNRYSEMSWKNGDGMGKYCQGKTTNLKAYCVSYNVGVGATADLQGRSGCIWRLCVSYCNPNKITCCLKYPYWRFNDVIIHPGKSKYCTTKGESQLFCTTTLVMFEFTYQE